MSGHEAWWKATDMGDGYITYGFPGWPSRCEWLFDFQGEG